MKVDASNPPEIGKWPLGSWSTSIGIAEPTLHRMLIRAGIRSTKTGFTAQQIFSALNSDQQTAKVQEAVARAKFYELRNQQINAELIPKALVRDALGTLRTAIREVVLNSTMPAEEQETLLRAIAQVEVMEAPPSSNGHALPRIGRRKRERAANRRKGPVRG
jgi:hypothetical protein